MNRLRREDRWERLGRNSTGAPAVAAIRRLSAIMAADVAGYSRLMEADEEGTHRRVKAHVREMIDATIGAHHGRIVKNTGDGFLADFPSVVDAFRCSVHMQRAMISRETELPEESQIRFRVGINLGDVIFDDNDIFGDGVNIAARLEALSEAGGVCISGAVADHVRDKLPCPLEDRGEQRVKNITRPVKVYCLSRAAIATLATDEPVIIGRRWIRYSRRAVVVGLGSVLVIGVGGSVPVLWRSRQKTSPTYAGAQRTALVIGISRYGQLSQLPNAERDAEVIAAKLENHGFRVIKKVDAERDTLVQAITDFETALSVVGGVGLFYYAGSAAYVDGMDVILPMV